MVGDLDGVVVEEGQEGVAQVDGATNKAVTTALYGGRDVRQQLEHAEHLGHDEPLLRLESPVSHVRVLAKVVIDGAHEGEEPRHHRYGQILP